MARSYTTRSGMAFSSRKLPAGSAKLPARESQQWGSTSLSEPQHKALENALNFHLRKRLPAIAGLLRACGHKLAHGILAENGGHAPGWNLESECEEFFQLLNRQTLSMAGFKECLPPTEQVRQVKRECPHA